MWKGTDRVLVVAPHTDDLELGCGATVARMIREGVAVSAVVLSSAPQSMPQDMPPDVGRTECQAAMKSLNVDLVEIHHFEVRRFASSRQEILDALIAARNAVNPTIVIGPGSADVHQDHAVTANEIMRAYRTSATILGFDLPWNGSVTGPFMTVAVSPDDLATKRRALECYASQVRLDRDYFSESMASGLAEVRAVKFGFEFAERLEVRSVVAP